MPLAVVRSGALLGVRGHPVDVEVNTGQSGDPKIVVVGLPDAAVKESSDRVMAAIQNSGGHYEYTRSTINLAPAHIKKEGPMYDLPIALAVMIATGQLKAVDDRLPMKYLIAGELSLSGETRPVRGGLPLAVLAREQGLQGILLPERSAREAAIATGISVYPVRSLDHARAYLEGRVEITPLPSPLSNGASVTKSTNGIDFSEVKGQHALRRAVEVAVSGAHNLLMLGPPGSGKSMVAKRIPTIMPEPSLDELLEILAVHSAAGKTIEEDEALRLRRPFRSPHHTISDVGLLGGGSMPGPGEISLAHNGVLFMDELPEFKRSVLEVLRQPLEDGEVTISRSAAKLTLPSTFMLVAAMNPCPCGYLGDRRRECRCSPTNIQRYRSRISGPLLDRIDIHIEAPALSIEELRTEAPSESSQTIRERVREARKIQSERLSKEGIICNSRMSHRHIRKHCALDKGLGDLLQQAMEQLNLSARAYDRILKVSRTIADLAGSEKIQAPHLLEAIQYRSLDRTVFY